MPTYVNPAKCDGCKGLDKTACQYICPNDLMKLDKSILKAFNQEPDMCWECFSCVKICPQNAIEMRGYADVMPMGATLIPLRGTDSIIWTVRYRNGQQKRFKFPIRDGEWGSIHPLQDAAPPDAAQFKTPALFGEARYLGVERLPSPAA